MNFFLRRMFLQHAQKLAKTNAPTVEHYDALLQSIAKVYEDDTGLKCECILIPPPKGMRQELDAVATLVASLGKEP